MLGAAVAVAEPRVFRVEPERAADGLGVEQADRLRPVDVEVVRGGRASSARRASSDSRRPRRSSETPSGSSSSSRRKSGAFGSDATWSGSCAEPRKPATWPGQLDHVVHHVRQGHERRQAAALGELMAEHRPQAGRVVAVVGQELEVALRGESAAERGERGRVVVRHRVVQAADDRQPVDDPRRVRQVLADLDTGHARRDRPELAADLPRGVRLHVPGVEVARAAVVEDQDARADGGGAGERRSGAASARSGPRCSAPARQGRRFGAIGGD